MEPASKSMQLDRIWMVSFPTDRIYRVFERKNGNKKILYDGSSRQEQLSVFYKNGGKL